MRRRATGTNHVPLPVDDSEERTEAQARAVGALPHTDEVTVTLLYVFEDWDESEDVPDIPTAGIVREVLSEARIETEREFGDPVEKIIGRHGGPTSTRSCSAGASTRRSDRCRSGA